MFLFLFPNLRSRGETYWVGARYRCRSVSPSSIRNRVLITNVSSTNSYLVFWQGLTFLFLFFGGTSILRSQGSVRRRCFIPLALPFGDWLISKKSYCLVVKITGDKVCQSSTLKNIHTFRSYQKKKSLFSRAKVEVRLITMSFNCECKPGIWFGWGLGKNYWYPCMNNKTYL